MRYSFKMSLVDPTCESFDISFEEFLANLDEKKCRMTELIDFDLIVDDEYTWYECELSDITNLFHCIIKDCDDCTIIDYWKSEMGEELFNELKEIQHDGNLNLLQLIKVAEVISSGWDDAMEFVFTVSI